MKILPVLLVTLTLLVAGCARNVGSRSPASATSPNSPPGTQIGGSDPAVNQPTTTTQTGRSNSATDDVPNTRR